MMLLHYAPEPVRFDPTRTYDQADLRLPGKPNGLWVSVPGDNDWTQWCEDEFVRHVYRVVLTADANIPRITDGDEADEFHCDYAAARDGPRDLWPINRTAVASDYDGLILAPFLAGHAGPSWFQDWVCASGCIWSATAIACFQEIT